MMHDHRIAWVHVVYILSRGIDTDHIIGNRIVSIFGDHREHESTMIDFLEHDDISIEFELYKLAHR